ncbi:hypothetical protein K432DRAFT_439991 [Lepidopterella palustris CBS 459.81]|uniref:Uncharacterized protein n=1 Tax=Lepidopterella palustris CBS 459.81 TaxID=1314670 RepID=A0A8E2JJB0_9PEZI|nr:hypothetical protein K432DRAFT_439991 [Lepidopterella palustris CBS 459.81]
MVYARLSPLVRSREEDTPPNVKQRNCLRLNSNYSSFIVTAHPLLQSLITNSSLYSLAYIPGFIRTDHGTIGFGTQMEIFSWWLSSCRTIRERPGREDWENIENIQRRREARMAPRRPPVPAPAAVVEAAENMGDDGEGGDDGDAGAGADLGDAITLVGGDTGAEFGETTGERIGASEGPFMLSNESWKRIGKLRKTWNLIMFQKLQETLEPMKIWKLMMAFYRL